MKTQLALFASAMMLTCACGGTVSTVGGDASVDQPADTVSDTSTDTTDEDVPLTCGDERVPPGGGIFPIVNGSPTFDSTVVALTDGQALAVGALMQRSGGIWTNICTATLITPTLVLTAAHCVRGWGGDEPASSFRFAVGNDVSSPIHMWQPTVVQSNPSYGGDAEYDVAILVLGEPATIAVPAIEPIPRNCTALSSTTFLHQNVQNVGYGATETGWGAPDNWVKWWTVEETIALSGYDFTVDGHGYSSVCYGDSGGPSLWTMPDSVVRVIGTVSWGDPSCMDEDHFARADYNCTFIAGFLEDCGEFDEFGVCDGDTAIWCESDSLTTVDCSATGRTCGDDGTGRNRCLDVPSPCGDVTFEGTCDGDTAIWCESDSLMSLDCTISGRVCGNDGTGAMRCIDPDACAGLGWEGRCEGDDAMWCADGVIMVRNCADCLQVCGWVEDMGGYYCIDPA